MSAEFQIPGAYPVPDTLPVYPRDFSRLTDGLAREVSSWCLESARAIPRPDIGMEDQEAVVVGLLVRTGKMLLRMAVSIGEGDGEATEICLRPESKEPILQGTLSKQGSSPTK